MKFIGDNDLLIMLWHAIREKNMFYLQGVKFKLDYEDEKTL